LYWCDWLNLERMLAGTVVNDPGAKGRLERICPKCVALRSLLLASHPLNLVDTF